MTSMLLRLSMSELLLLRPALLDVLGHHVLIRGEPVRDLHELTVLHLPDLHQPATLVVGVGDLERRHQPAQGEVRVLLETRIGYYDASIFFCTPLRTIAHC